MIEHKAIENSYDGFYLIHVKTRCVAMICYKNSIVSGNIRIHKPQNLSMKFKDEFIQQLTLNMKEGKLVNERSDFKFL